MNKLTPQQIGEALAHLQDLMDTFIHTLVKRAKVSSTSERKTLKTLGFFSKVGDAYYTKYREIKKKKE